MMSYDYLMHNEEEIIRLEQNVDPMDLKEQALWCGLKPGIRVLEVGCGPGKTTSILWELIQPEGEILGISYLEEMIDHAKRHYGNKEGIGFHKMDFLSPFNSLGSFDLVWIRFVIEYHLKEGFEIVKNAYEALRSGGTLCLLDLDHNCLNYHPISKEMEDVIFEAVSGLKEEYNFDPFAGRRLYTYLFDLGLKDIEVHIRPYHLIFGKIGESQLFNWMKKAEVLAGRMEGIFEKYPGGKNKFLKDFKEMLLNERRFIYTPIIMCKGIKP